MIWEIYLNSKSKWSFFNGVLTRQHFIKMRQSAKKWTPTCHNRQRRSTNFWQCIVIVQISPHTHFYYLIFIPNMSHFSVQSRYYLQNMPQEYTILFENLFKFIQIRGLNTIQPFFQLHTSKKFVCTWYSPKIK